MPHFKDFRMIELQYEIRMFISYSRVLDKGFTPIVHSPLPTLYNQLLSICASVRGRPKAFLLSFFLPHF